MGTYEVLKGRTVARPVVYRSDAALVRVSLSCAIMEPTAIFPVYVEDEVDSGPRPMWRSLRSKLISCPVSPSYLVPSEQRLVHRSPRSMAHLQGHTRATGGGAAERRAHVERHPSPAPRPTTTPLSGAELDGTRPFDESNRSSSGRSGFLLTRSSLARRSLAGPLAPRRTPKPPAHLRVCPHSLPVCAGAPPASTAYDSGSPSSFDSPL